MWRMTKADYFLSFEGAQILDEIWRIGPRTQVGCLLDFGRLVAKLVGKYFRRLHAANIRTRNKNGGLDSSFVDRLRHGSGLFHTFPGEITLDFRRTVRIFAIDSNAMAYEIDDHDLSDLLLGLNAAKNRTQVEFTPKQFGFFG